MKQFIAFLILLCMLHLHAFGKDKTIEKAFCQNMGQICDKNLNAHSEILFSASLPNLNIYIKKNSIIYQFLKTYSEKGTATFNHKPKENLKKHYASDQIEFQLVNTNSEIIIETEEKESYFSNFYLANCSNGITNVNSFKKIILKNTYNNIDWVLYFNESGLKYDFIVHPGGNVSDIKFEYKNTLTTNINSVGELEIESILGKIKESNPITSQSNNIQIENKFQVSKNSISFNIGDYDKDQDLIIDPGVEWSTYFGGSGQDVTDGALADIFGNLFLYGSTTSFGLGQGGFQDSIAGTLDIFISKFDANGNKLWSTYYGGYLDEYSSDASSDPFGNLYIAISTASDTGLAYQGFQNNPTGQPVQNCNLLAKFNINGQRVWATYYGGVSEGTPKCSSDQYGNIYLGGSTSETFLISTSGSFQESFNGTVDMYLAKFDSSCNRIWATYFGGIFGEEMSDMTCDKNNSIYLCGTTESDGLGYNGFKDTLSSYRDAILVKFDSSGSRLWSTYYGGSGAEYFSNCTSDNSGNVYLCGATNSPDQIAYNGFQNSHFGTTILDGYAVKFDSSGSRIWGSYYGGNRYDEIRDCNIDADNNLLITGQTFSDTILGYHGYHNFLYNGGLDAFLASFDGDGNRLWSTYYGGEETDYGTSCFADISGNIYLAGRTESLNGIALNGYQNTNGGNTDCFLVKLNCSGFTSPQIIGNINPEINSQYTYSVDSNLILDYIWEITGGQILSGQGTDSIEVRWDISGPGTIELFAMYSPGCYNNSTLNALINNIHPLIDNKITPFPNPFNSEVTIYPNYNYDLTLKDVLGRTLLQSNDAYTLNTETLPSGIYILVVNSTLKDNSVVFKIIKN